MKPIMLVVGYLCSYLMKNIVSRSRHFSHAYHTCLLIADVVHDWKLYSNYNYYQLKKGTFQNTSIIGILIERSPFFVMPVLLLNLEVAARIFRRLNSCLANSRHAGSQIFCRCLPTYVRMTWRIYMARYSVDVSWCICLLCFIIELLYATFIGLSYSWHLFNRRHKDVALALKSVFSCKYCVSFRLKYTEALHTISSLLSAYFLFSW